MTFASIEGNKMNMNRLQLPSERRREDALGLTKCWRKARLNQRKSKNRNEKNKMK